MRRIAMFFTALLLAACVAQTPLGSIRNYARTHFDDPDFEFVAQTEMRPVDMAQLKEVDYVRWSIITAAKREAGSANLSEIDMRMRVKNREGGKELRTIRCYLRTDTMETLYCESPSL